jgi:hypothetical protein
VQLDSFRTGRRHRHVHAQAYGCDRRAGRDNSGDVEGEHTAAEFTHAVLTGEEVKTSAVAMIALGRVVLVEVLSLLGKMLIVAAFTNVAPVQPSAVVSISASDILELLIEC